MSVSESGESDGPFAKLQKWSNQRSLASEVIQLLEFGPLAPAMELLPLLASMAALFMRRGHPGRLELISCVSCP